ncbi:uncharacterized protein JCM6883_003460 [Sporobolomyces salmoneus]|uniref:uncharacterized protein n=1 Tax=Sporobolomyces salmoneus TaxID=183962 RepID=UPI00317D2888
MVAISYDLSPLYRHSTTSFVPTSPSLLLSSHSSKLILRSSTTLQIIRTWTLPVPSSSNSSNLAFSISPVAPHLILAFASNPTARERVWVLDPGKEGVVARFEVGRVEGCERIEWSRDGERVLIWAENNLRISIFSLKEPSKVLQINSPKATATDSTTGTGGMGFGFGYDFSQDGEWFAVLERHEFRDCLAIYSTSGGAKRDDWRLMRNIVIPDPTSDLIGLKFSPNGQYIVAWSSITHYYLHIFTLDGRLIKTFDPYSTFNTSSTSSSSSSASPSASSSLKSSRAPAKPSSASKSPSSAPSSESTTTRSLRIGNPEKAPRPASITSSPGGYVGLGIRTVEWSVDGEFLAIGGYDGKIRVLSKSVNWELITELSVPNKIVHASNTMVCREPSNGWVEKTLGKGIITCTSPPSLSLSQAHVPLLYLAEDSYTSKPFPRMGWSRIEWSRDGKWLVGVNQSYPNHLYIYQFLTNISTTTTTPEEEGRRRSHIRPRLHSLLVFNAPAKSFRFKSKSVPPSFSSRGHADGTAGGEEEEEETSMVILSGSKCFTTWTFTSTRQNPTASTNSEEEEEERAGGGNRDGEKVVVEGIGIPTPPSVNFSPNIIEFSPVSYTSGSRGGDGEEGEEEVMLLGEKGGMFCLVYPVKDTKAQGGAEDRTWIEGEDY